MHPELGAGSPSHIVTTVNAVLSGRRTSADARQSSTKGRTSSARPLSLRAFNRKSKLGRDKLGVYARFARIAFKYGTSRPESVGEGRGGRRGWGHEIQTKLFQEGIESTVDAENMLVCAHDAGSENAGCGKP